MKIKERRLDKIHISNFISKTWSNKL